MSVKVFLPVIFSIQGTFDLMNQFLISLGGSLDRDSTVSFICVYIFWLSLSFCLLKKTVNEFLQQLFESGSLTDAEFNQIKDTGSNPVRLYGLAKIHKALENCIPKFRPILRVSNSGGGGSNNFTWVEISKQFVIMGGGGVIIRGGGNN